MSAQQPQQQQELTQEPQQQQVPTLEQQRQRLKEMAAAHEAKLADDALERKEQSAEARRARHR